MGTVPIKKVLPFFEKDLSVKMFSDMKMISNRNRPHYQTGQAIVLVALTLLVMCLFAFNIINTGVVFYRRIQMQNAADCAALSSARITARALNTVATCNNVISFPSSFCTPGFLPTIFWGMTPFMLKSMKGVYEAMRSIETAWVRAGVGQAAAVGFRVARLNGADTWIPTGGFSLRLRGRRIRVFYYKRCIRIPTPSGTILIPIPDFGNFPKNYDPAYYRRTWATGTKKAQPTHRISYVVSKRSYQPFGRALFGGSMSSNRTYASARARVFYDCRRNYGFHYGGFPRSRSGSWMEKAFIPQPFASFPVGGNPAQFNAYLVPVPGYMGIFH